MSSFNLISFLDLLSVWQFSFSIFFFHLRVPEKEFLKAFKTNPRLKTKVNNFHRQMASSNNSEEDFVAIRPEWTTVDRVLACRFYYLEIFSLFANLLNIGPNLVMRSFVRKIYQSYYFSMLVFSPPVLLCSLDLITIQLLQLS